MQLITHIRIDHRADLDGRVLGSKGFNDLAHCGVFAQRQIETGSDIDQNTACALQVNVFQQRITDRRFSRFAGTVRTAGTASTHHRHTHFAHHGFHVSKVDVHQAFTQHDVGDAAYGAGQHVVRLGKRGKQAGVFTENGQQLFVRNGDQRIDALRQRANALVGHLHTLLAFERERTGHNGDRQDAHFFGDLSNDRRCTGAGAAAHTRGDEHHVGALQHLGNTFTVFHRRLATDFRISTRAQALSDGCA